jgi:hypothetical protein
MELTRQSPYIFGRPQDLSHGNDAAHGTAGLRPRAPEGTVQSAGTAVLLLTMSISETALRHQYRPYSCTAEYKAR